MDRSSTPGGEEAEAFEARRMAACAHCQRPVDPAPVETEHRAFCCSGCRWAFELLHDGGLTRFYDLRRGPGMPIGEARVLPASGAAIWLERALAEAPDGTLTCDVQGMHCAGCVWLIDTLYRRHPGAGHVRIDPGLGRLALRFDADSFDPAAFVEELGRFGYLCGPPRKDAAHGADDLLIRFGVTAAAAANAMMLAVPGYLGLEPGDADGLHTLFSWAGFALATLAVLVGGPVFFRGAWQGLKRRVLHLDLPISLAVVLAWSGSAWLLASGREDAVYFDSLAVFVALMLLGRWLQRRLVVRNRRLLLADGGAGALVSRVVTSDERVLLRPVGELAAGDVLLLAPGELLPVDAELLGDRRAEIDLAWSTGEPDPIPVDPGTRLSAGAHLASREAVRVVALDTFAGGALESLLGQRPDVGPARDGLWHRVSAIYVVAVLGLAGAAAWAWWGAGSLAALEIATAVLVVTCPCAIGLALPLGRELGAARLRRLGLYVRRADLFDRLASVTDVLLDKTGTLTGSRPVVDAAGVADLPREARTALYQMVVRSHHPRSRALLDALGTGETLDAAATVVETPGVGLRYGPWSLSAGPMGSTTLRHGDARVADFTFREPLRADARAQVAALVDGGLRVHVLSGDAPDRVRSTAERAGVDPSLAVGGLSPEAKAEHVRALPEDRTLFVGDGINDGPALDAAWCAGTPAVDRPSLPARADFFMLGGRLGPIAELVATARAVRRATRRNLAFAVTYNVVGVAAAMAGWIGPLAAALLMPASSLLVLGATAWALRPAGSPTLDRAPALPSLVPAGGVSP